MKNVLILLGDKGKLSCKFESWNSNGGWLGKDGAEEWGNENSLFCIEFDDSGVIKDAYSRSRIYSIETFPLQANGVFRFINLKRNLVSDVYVTVNIYNNEQL